MGMQFLVEGIKKAKSTDSDKVSKALLGLSVDTPIGKHDDPRARTIRPTAASSTARR